MRNLLLVAILTFLACEKECNETLGPAADFIGNQVAIQLDCKKPALIADDILTACSKVGLCKKAAEMTPAEIKGAIANNLCPGVSKALVSIVVGAAVPAKYECAPGATVDKLAYFVEIACKMYVPL